MALLVTLTEMGSIHILKHMKKTLLSLLTLAVLLTGCITKNPQNLTPIPPLPPMSQASTPPLPPMPVARKLMAVRAMATAPAGSIFFDPFDSGVATPWTFYQGTRLFTNGILRLTVANNAGMYAYVRTNWTNISVSADIKLGATSWGAAVGLRYNPTNGANYQAWIYRSGRLTIERYSNWYNTWQEVAGTSITAPGTTTNNVKLAMTNNILTAYLNGTQRLTYTDPTPLRAGGIDLGVWGGNGSCTADFDNVTVYDLAGGAIVTAPPVLLTGLTNVLGLQGQSTTLSVSATGTALTYVWQTPNGTVASTSNTYTITNIQRAGSIGVSITNVLGKVNSSAYLSMGTTNILSGCVPMPAKTTATLAWCPSPSTTNSTIAGYKLYYGSTNPPVANWRGDVYDTNQPLCPGVLLTSGTNFFRTYTNVVNAGTNLTATVSNLVAPRTYYFAATAYDTNALESDYSSEVSLTITNLVPKPPSNVNLTVVAIGGGQMKLQAKVCPSTLTTVLYQNMLGLPWNILATNVLADVYGNFLYIDVPTNSMRFYRALLQ